MVCRTGRHREPLSKEDMLPSLGVCWHLQGLLQLLRTSTLEIKPFLRQLTSNKWDWGTKAILARHKTLWRTIFAPDIATRLSESLSGLQLGLTSSSVQFYFHLFPFTQLTLSKHIIFQTHPRLWEPNLWQQASCIGSGGFPVKVWMT